MTDARIELVGLDLADAEVAARVLALQRRAYRVESELVGSDEIPPLHESLDELVASGETFLGALVGGQLAGVIAWRLDGETLDIHRLVVEPAYFRRGIGVALVRAALAAGPAATLAIVQTGASNEPARMLYLGEGFEHVDEIEAAPGLRVARFRKLLRS